MQHLIRRFSSTLSPAVSASTLHVRVKDLVSKELHDDALTLYKHMLQPSGLHACSTLLPSVIKACTFAPSLHFGLQLHCIAIKSGSDSDPVVSNSLISMCAKLSTTESARKLFDNMPQRDVITYNSMINCYTQNGHLLKALEMLKELYLIGFVPKPELLAGILSLCARKKDSRTGKAIHALVIVDARMKESVFMSTALVDMYLKCHENVVALHVFVRMGIKNEVSWTAVVAGCIADHNYGMGIDCFRAMQSEGIRPNRVTLVTVLPACAELGCVRLGKEIHGYAFRHGFDLDHYMSAALINMYCKCGYLQHPARLVFETSRVKDVVTWSSIIGGYARGGYCTEAMKLFSQMRAGGLQPNSVSLLALIFLCTRLSSIEYGNGVHGYIVKFGSIFDIFIGNALIDMYSKCGCLLASHQIFEEMPIQDSVSWSSLISAYGLHGYGDRALELFHEMQDREIKPDAMTILAVLSACGHAGLVEEGQRLFNEFVRSHEVPFNIEHYACYIDLLGRSGKVEDACDVVRKMPMRPSAKIWGSLVSACKAHGRFDLAEMLADQLIKAEPQDPANYTLLSMMYAESGRWLDVEEVRRVMKLQGLNKSCGFSRIELGSECYL